MTKHNTSLFLLFLFFTVFIIDQTHSLSRCDVVKFLRSKRASNLRTWVCIAAKESSYRHDIKGGPNRNKSYDHGLWQINDNYWCDNRPEFAGKSNDCKSKCAKFRDADLNDDWTCVQKIQKRHGFSAWTTFSSCRNANAESKWDSGC